MAIEVIRKSLKARAKIESGNISNAQFWRNWNNTILLTVPSRHGEGLYLLMVLESNGMIEYTASMDILDLVNHLNKHLFEEINCTIELNL